MAYEPYPGSVPTSIYGYTAGSDWVQKRSFGTDETIYWDVWLEDADYGDPIPDVSVSVVYFDPADKMPSCPRCNGTGIDPTEGTICQLCWNPKGIWIIAGGWTDANGEIRDHFSATDLTDPPSAIVPPGPGTFYLGFYFEGNEDGYYPEDYASSIYYWGNVTVEGVAGEPTRIVGFEAVDVNGDPRTTFTDTEAMYFRGYLQDDKGNPLDWVDTNSRGIGVGTISDSIFYSYAGPALPEKDPNKGYWSTHFNAGDLGVGTFDLYAWFNGTPEAWVESFAGPVTVNITGRKTAHFSDVYLRDNAGNIVAEVTLGTRVHATGYLLDEAGNPVRYADVYTPYSGAPKTDENGYFDLAWTADAESGFAVGEIYTFTVKFDGTNDYLGAESSVLSLMIAVIIVGWSDVRTDKAAYLPGQSANITGYLYYNGIPHPGLGTVRLTLIDEGTGAETDLGTDNTDANGFFTHWTGSLQTGTYHVRCSHAPLTGEPSWVDTNRFTVSEEPVPGHVLTIRVQGPGSATIVVQGAAYQVAGSQSFTFDEGTNVSVEAGAVEAWSFVSWSDGGARKHTVVMDSDKDLTAVYEEEAPPPPRHDVYLAVAGPESATIRVDGSVHDVTDLPSKAGAYDEYTVIEVEAQPVSGWVFMSWSDGGTNPHSLTITAETYLTATYVEEAILQYALTVTAVTDSTSLVFDVSVDGIEWGKTPHTFTVEEGVHPVAVPTSVQTIDPDDPEKEVVYKFNEWADGPFGNVRVINVQTDISIEAVYDKEPVLEITELPWELLTIGAGAGALMIGLGMETEKRKGRKERKSKKK